MLFLYLIIFKRNQLKQLNLKMLLSGAFIGVWLFLGYATQTIGLLYTTTSKAGFITGLSVVLVPLFSMLLLKQFPTRNAVVGVLTATIGLFLLTMTDVSSLNMEMDLCLSAQSPLLYILFLQVNTQVNTRHYY